MREFKDLTRSAMVKNHEAFQSLGQQHVETAIKLFGDWSKGWRTITAEMTDFTKQSFEDGVATIEKLLLAKSIDQAIRIQSDFTARTIDGYFHKLSKMRGMHTQLLKDFYEPLGQMLQTGVQRK
jgi:hypothetical protein